MTRTAILSIFAAVVLGQPPVPENLAPPAGEELKMKVHATGDQVYACDGSKWILRAPDAKLFDESGQQVGTHFAGPTWRWSDGSQVTGKAVANASPDPDSIPWLLVTVTDHSGTGVMTNVATIQRLHTKGGKAPASCESSQKDEQKRVHYTADYYFYAPRP